MKYILSNPRLVASSKLLAKKIQEISETTIYVSTIPDKGGDCIIRWGTSRGVTELTNYNNHQHIYLAGNKYKLSEFLKEAKFPHVEIYDPEEPITKYPLVLRKELNRGGGIGIVIVENEEQLRKEGLEHFWSYWYNFKFELGVHILGGKIVRVFKKVRSDGLEEEKFPIRNTHRGYKFSLKENWQENYGGLEKYVGKLFEILPIQMARLDIGYSRESGYRLIEINSAPDLTQNENTLNIYAKFLAERLF